MEELPAIGFGNVNDATVGKSFYDVHLADGSVRRYEFFDAVQMRSYKHIYGALDNPGAYRFYDNDGVLVIELPEPQP